MLATGILQHVDLKLLFGCDKLLLLLLLLLPASCKYITCCRE
jgi:hypothetical protein